MTKLIFHLFSDSRSIPIVYILLPNLNENFTQIIRKDQDLHVFILDGQRSNVEQFKKVFGLRNRSDKEYWLLDISAINNPEERLQDLFMDLDDDLIWFSRDKKGT